MSVHVFESIIRQLPTEAAIVIASTDEVICMSPRIEKLCQEFSEDALLAVARTCRDQATVTLSVSSLMNNRRKKLLGLDQVELRFTSKVVPWRPSVRIVTIERLPAYDELLEEYELISYTAETLNRGIGLMCQDPTNQRTWFDYATDKFAELCGCSVRDLTQFGFSVVLAIVHEDNRTEVQETLFSDSIPCEEWSVSARLLIEGEYVWRRFIGNTNEGDGGTIQLSMICEDFTEGAAEQARKRTSKDRSASFMLSSFISAVFDASFYVDDEFRIVDDLPKLRYFFSTDPEVSLKGRLVESFMTSEDDRMRFREYLTKPLEAQAATDPDYGAGTLPAAPMIRLRLNLAGDQLTDVELYASPTYVRAIEGFDSSTVDCVPTLVVGNATAQSGSMYLVGIRVISSTPPPSAGVQACPLPEDTTSASSSSSQRRVRRRKTRGIPLLAGVPEDSECSDSEDGRGSVRSSGRGVGASQTSAPRRSLIAHALQRFLSRDLIQAMDDLDELPSSSSGKGGPSLTWLVPLYQISDMVVMEEELVRSLPNLLQGDFIRASRAANYNVCSNLLTSSMEGNVNILQQAVPGKPQCENPDLVHCTYRFFLGLVSRASVEVSYRLLLAIGESIRRISPIIGRSGTEVAVFEFTLSLVTAGVRHPEWFSTAGSIQWLRKSFTDAMKMPEARHIDKSRRLPSMYYLCVLWGALMQSLGRMEEATALLENLFEEMLTYCQRHPESTGVRKLQAVCAHNMAIVALTANDLYKAFNWVHKLQTILFATHVSFPNRCHQLVQWAEKTQSTFQQSEVKGG